MFEKRAFRKNLDSLSVSFVDTDINSTNIFNVLGFRRELSSGKNIFRFAPEFGLFKRNSPIELEVLDAQGNPIYSEILNYIDDSNANVASIYVYPSTPRGYGYIYLTGTAIRHPRTGQILNTTKPNIRWQQRIYIAPARRNDSSIIFVQQPYVSISDSNQRFLSGSSNRRIQNTKALDSLLMPETKIAKSISVLPFNEDTKYGYFGSGTPTIQLINNTDQIGSELYTYFNNRPGLSGLNYEGKYSGIGRIPGEFIQKDVITSTSQSVSQPQLIVPKERPIIRVKNFAFTPDMVGGEIRVVAPNVSDFLPNDISNPSAYNPASQDYVATIVRIHNTSSAEVSQPFLYTREYRSKNGSTKKFIINRFNVSSNFTMSFAQAPAPAVFSSIVDLKKKQSFAEIEFKRLQPATGDIYKIKTLYKPIGSFGDFVDLGDTVIGDRNILVDTGITLDIGDDPIEIQTTKDRGTIRREIGIFHHDIDPANYWLTSSYNGNDAGDFTLKSRKLLQSLNVSGSIANAQQGIILQSKKSFTAVADTIYSVELNALAEYFSLANPVGVIQPQIDVYIGGLPVETSVQDKKNVVAPLYDRSVLGNYIGSIVAPYDSIRFNERLFFKAKADGDGYLTFLLRKGSWHLANIRVNVTSNQGFTPNYTRIDLPLQDISGVKDTELVFKFQYFNYVGQQADVETLVYGVNFSGSNVVLTPGDIIQINITGSNTTGSGQDTDWFESSTYLSASKDVQITGSMFISGAAEIKGSGSAVFRIRNELNEIITDVGDSADGYFLEIGNSSSETFFAVGDSKIYISQSVEASASFDITGSVTASALQLRHLTEQAYTQVLVRDSATGDVAYTASSAFGAGGGSGQDTDWFDGGTYLTASKDVQITGSLTVLDNNLLIRSGGLYGDHAATPLIRIQNDQGVFVDFNNPTIGLFSENTDTNRQYVFKNVNSDDIVKFEVGLTSGYQHFISGSLIVDTEFETMCLTASHARFNDLPNAAGAASFNRVLLVDAAGNVRFTSSAAFGGGGSGQDTDWFDGGTYLTASRAQVQITGSLRVSASNAVNIQGTSVVSGDVTFNNGVFDVRNNTIKLGNSGIDDIIITGSFRQSGSSQVYFENLVEIENDYVIVYNKVNGRITYVSSSYIISSNAAMISGALSSGQDTDWFESSTYLSASKDVQITGSLLLSGSFTFISGSISSNDLGTPMILAKSGQQVFAAEADTDAGLYFDTTGYNGYCFTSINGTIVAKLSADNPGTANATPHRLYGGKFEVTASTPIGDTTFEVNDSGSVFDKSIRYKDPNVTNSTTITLTPASSRLQLVRPNTINNVTIQLPASSSKIDGMEFIVTTFNTQNVTFESAGTNIETYSLNSGSFQCLYYDSVNTSIVPTKWIVTYLGEPRV